MQKHQVLSFSLEISEFQVVSFLYHIGIIILNVGEVKYMLINLEMERNGNLLCSRLVAFDININEWFLQIEN